MPAVLSVDKSTESQQNLQTLTLRRVGGFGLIGDGSTFGVCGNEAGDLMILSFQPFT